jgi:hypothetical protein
MCAVRQYPWQNKEGITLDLTPTPTSCLSIY